MLKDLPTSPFVVVLCGLPGSGKTSLAMEITSSLKNFNFDTNHICFDQIEQSLGNTEINWDVNIWRTTREKVYEQVKELLVENGQKARVIILDDNMYYRSMRYTYYKLAKII